VCLQKTFKNQDISLYRHQGAIFIICFILTEQVKIIVTHPCEKKVNNMKEIFLNQKNSRILNPEGWGGGVYDSLNFEQKQLKMA
jgi:hypothetical protein